MKGIELPINVLIIVAVALIALLGIIALYFSGFNPFSGAMNIEAVKNEACRELVQERRCAGPASNVVITDFSYGDPPQPIATLAAYCSTVLKPALTDAECKKMCGCP